MAFAFNSPVNKNQKKSLAAELQQIKKLLAQCGRAGSETDNSESATGDVQHLASVCRGVYPPSSMSLRNHGILRAAAECVVSLLAGDRPHLEDLLVHHPKAEMRAAQRAQLGRKR